MSGPVDPLDNAVRIQRTFEANVANDLCADGSSVILTSLQARRLVQPPTQRWQILWNAVSERVNPIVVKEARQSLNSNEFVIAYTFTLLCIVLWTITGVTIQLPQLYYLPGGMMLLAGYIVILSFPLLLIIPYSAFRSMVTECEERTFELVSISALSARQIVNGKLYTSLLQIVIYLATLTPCFVITYLLRGVLLSSIVYCLIFTLLLSVLLTAISILMATLSRIKVVQILASIILLGGLLIITIYWGAFTAATLATWELDDFGGQLVVVLAAVVASVVPVCMRSSAAAIDFPSENHATPLRVRLAIFVAVSLSCCIYVTIDWKLSDPSVFILGSLIFFLGLGALITAERGVLSLRAQRHLPKTLIERFFMTWFYPGAGLGYIFLAGLFASFLLPWCLLEYLPGSSFRWSSDAPVIPMCLFCWLYLLFYAGLNRLILMIIPRTLSGRMVASLLLQAMLVAVGSSAPGFIAFVLNDFREIDYAWPQFGNIAWTLSEVMSSNGIVTPALLALALSTVVVFGLNLFLCERDVLMVRIQAPRRVQEEIQSHQPSPSSSSSDPFA